MASVTQQAGASPEVMAELLRLRADNERLRASNQRGTLGVKIGDKGTLSISGLGRFPFSGYVMQWVKIFRFMGKVAAFVLAHADDPKLVWGKPEDSAETKAANKADALAYFATIAS